MSDIEKAIGIIERMTSIPEQGESFKDDIEPAYRIAITALQEKLEREKGCEWCAGDTQWQPDLLDGCAGGYRKPKYCPECGKRLKGSDQHE